MTDMPLQPPQHNESLLIHRVLAHSYLVYFAGIVVGVFLDVVFRVRLSESASLTEIGFVSIVLGSILIIWAQKTSRTTHMQRNSAPSLEDFLRGPYRFCRGPTHIGLFLLIAGFGLLVNSVFIVLVTIAIYLSARLFFLPAEESRLLKKYGAVYQAYLKKVRF